MHAAGSAKVLVPVIPACKKLLHMLCDSLGISRVQSKSQASLCRKKLPQQYTHSK